MARRKYTDTVSPKPRVRVDENGVIDIAGLMRDIHVRDSVKRFQNADKPPTDTKTMPPVVAPDVPD